MDPPPFAPPFAPPFERLDAPLPERPPGSPVVISVPHAGRDYPKALRAALRVPFAQVTALEDRLVDRIACEARSGQPTIIQTRARAWIDLNRGEHERDPQVDDGAPALPLAGQSAKLRSGLGLVPRRAVGPGPLWTRRFSDAEITARIVDDHRCYHDALKAMLAAAQARFGVAVLLDLHSMPPLEPRTSDPKDRPAQIVIGDRFGHAAAARFVARVEAETNAHGFACALNAPYAGGHILERHGNPAGNVHAIQLELDRSLYLDRRLREPGAGFDRVVGLLEAILAALADEALAEVSPLALAAE